MKTNDNNFNESLDFITRHYQEDAFSDEQKEKAFNFVTGSRRRHSIFMRPRRIAAAAVATALLASASCYFYITRSDNKTENLQPAQEIINLETTPVEIATAVIEFNDSPLSDVVNEIEKVYGVRILNTPEKEYRLTLRYEGNVEELLETINELLDIHLEIDNKK